MFTRVIPINYNIELWDLELGGDFSYQGCVTIEINIKTAVKTITLNAHQLNIDHGEVNGEKVQGMDRVRLRSSNAIG